MMMPDLTLIGFDSAWTDNPKAPSALTALQFGAGQGPLFHPPRLATFAEALAIIRSLHHHDGLTFIALDQPTIVPNQTGKRPVERAASRLMGRKKTAVQLSNRGKTRMFCDAAPIWPFLAELGAIQDPLASRFATSGIHLAEVYPALALFSLAPEFYDRGVAARYNPANRGKFRIEDWVRVAEIAAIHFDPFGCAEAAAWCRAATLIASPRKADQDKLDAMVCLVVALLWMRGDPSDTLMLGDLATGYMVLPASPKVSADLAAAADHYGVQSKQAA